MIDDNPGLVRLKKEFEDLEENPMSEIGCQIWLTDEDNYYEWKGFMQGPTNTPYTGAILYFTISFQSDFPNSPPNFRFSYKNMYHLNISPYDGHACVSIVNDWNPKTKIRQVIHAVNIILKDQNPDDPYPGKSEMIELYRNNRSKFDENVKEWVRNNALKTHK